MAGSKTLIGYQVLYQMADVQDVLNALDQAARHNHWDSIKIMVMHYNDASNPLRKLVNQHNAAVELLQTKPKGEA